jgi:hypothetical protein
MSTHVTASCGRRCMLQLRADMKSSVDTFVTSKCNSICVHYSCCRGRVLLVYIYSNRPLAALSMDRGSDLTIDCIVIISC